MSVPVVAQCAFHARGDGSPARLVARTRGGRTGHCHDAFADEQLHRPKDKLPSTPDCSCASARRWRGWGAITLRPTSRWDPTGRAARRPGGSCSSCGSRSQAAAAVQTAERSDPVAQALIKEFCELINFPYQQQQGLFAVGFYQGIMPLNSPVRQPPPSGPRPTAPHQRTKSPSQAAPLPPPKRRRLICRSGSRRGHRRRNPRRCLNRRHGSASSDEADHVQEAGGLDDDDLFRAARPGSLSKRRLEI